MNTEKLILGFATSIRWGLLIVNNEGEVRYVNSAVSSILGYGPTELIGKPITTIIPERLRGAHNSGMERAVELGEARLAGSPVEVHALRSDGSEVPIEMTLSVWSDGGQVWAGAMIKDVSDRRARDARLLRLATRDALTGLLNDKAFRDRLSEDMMEGPTSVLIINLGGFREVLDLFGRVISDSLIQAVSVRLLFVLGHESSVARLRGDDFAVFIRGFEPRSKAETLATELVHTFNKPFSLGGMEFQLSASIGIAISKPENDDAEVLLAAADFALQKAISRGGRTFSFFDDGMRQENESFRILRDELREALTHDQLKLYYQPQYELVSKRLVGFEALIRWQHPERGLLAPAVFLPLLHRSILALDIGWWTLEEACRVAACLNRHGHYKMAVNLFPMQFRAPTLVDRVDACVKRHQLSPDKIELELTEEIALDDVGAAIDTAKALRRIGVGVAFDDFGTGYASLSSLQKIPLSTLKIDRSFVRHVHEKKSSDAAIVRALIGMSSDLGLLSIAEGIETLEQEAALIDIGCTVGQGFLYGKPADEAATLKIVLADRSNPALRT